VAISFLFEQEFRGRAPSRPLRCIARRADGLALNAFSMIVLRCIQCAADIFQEFK
jgi:hypothetical protein